MILSFVISNFEIIVFVGLLLVVISCISIFYLQNMFISNTSKNIESLNKLIKLNNVELLEYLKTLSGITENNKNSLDQLSKKINALEKETTRMIDVKGSEDMLSLAIELARKGEKKELIKEKTGLSDDEIDTIYTYHRNLSE